MKKQIFLLVLLFAAFVFSACSKKQVPGERSADYTCNEGTHTLNIAFQLGKEYTFLAPLELPYEEYRKHSEELMPYAPGNYEVYKDGTLVFSIYVDGNRMIPDWISPYDSRLANSKMNGTLLDEGSTDLYDYIFYQTNGPVGQNVIYYTYRLRFRYADDIGLQAGQCTTREDAEKIFQSMEVWFTKYSMELHNITENVSADDHGEIQTIEADMYPEGAKEASHIVVDVNNKSVVSGTNPELLENLYIYQAKACEELIRYVNEGREETEFQVEWE